MAPIYNIPGITGTHIDDESAVVEVGRIRKGETETVKKKGSQDTFERPRNLDYFRVTLREDLDELQALYDRQVLSQPRQLRVQLAYPNLDESWWAWNSIYKAGGMLGLHDGVWWNYFRDPVTNAVLVSDYMLTPDALAKIENDQINGHTICEASEAYQDYLNNYHTSGTPLPRPWKKVAIAIDRGLNPKSLIVDPLKPIYTTGSGDKLAQYFATPEGRLMLTMPHLEGFTSFHLFQFKTGSFHDIRKISQNLATIAAQSKLFDGPLGSISLDAVPMLLVRRKEIITKPINGKLTKAPEWLVNIQTVAKWQRFVDDMQLHMNVKKMMAAVEQEFSGLSQTAEHIQLPELPEPELPFDEDGDILEGELLEAGLPVEINTETEEVQEEQPQKPAPKKPPAKKANLKPREVDPDVMTESYNQAKALLSDENISIGSSEFWGSVYGMGYSQKDAEPFLTTEDWRICLTNAVTDYEKKNAA